MSQLNSQIGQQGPSGAIGQQAGGQLFPQQFTQQTGNLVAALAVKGRADYYNQNAREGFGAGTGTIQYGIGTDIGADLSNAVFAPQQIALQQGIANSQQALQQQQARDQEGQGFAQLGLQNQQAQNQLALQQQGSLMRFLLGVA